LFDEKQNTGTFFMTDIKKTVQGNLNEELTLKFPKKRKVKKSRKRPHSVIEQHLG